QFAALKPQQRTAVRNAQSSVSGPWPGKAKAGPGAFVVAGGLCLFVIVMSFVGALLGWILIMRKRVLPCTLFGAVVTASYQRAIRCYLVLPICRLFGDTSLYGGRNIRQVAV